MNKLTNFRKFVFASIITLFGVISNAQTLSPQNPAMAPETYGTEANPYLITSAEDWNSFTGNNAYWASGVCVRLDDNITVSTMAGTSSKMYKGSFDGNWHTLTFNKGTTDDPFTESYCAPFRYINGATIQNLTITGKIVSSKKYMGGFAAWAQGSASSFTNCTSSIEIDCSQIDNGDGSGTITDMKQWDCSVGGFIGQIQKVDVTFVNCVFDGNIHRGTGENTQPYANRGAGFVSYVQDNGAIFTNCTMAGIVDLNIEDLQTPQPQEHKDWLSTFGRNNKNTYNGTCYYTRTTYGDVPKPNCIEALNEPNDLSRKYMVGSTPKYVPGAVFTGLDQTVYQYVGTPIVLTPSTVRYYGKTLTRGTDYVIRIDGGDPVYDLTFTFNGGNHVLSIEGNSSNYVGAHKVYVVELNSWTALKTALNADNGTFTLTGNITADVESNADTNFVVKGNITLNLGGFTINRGLVHVNEDYEVVADYAPDYKGPGRVIKIKKGASLTINGPGTITGGYHKAEDGTDNKSENDGGGIWNMGNLVLNEVTVSGNKIEKLDPTSTTLTGRGGGIYSGDGSSFEMNDGEISYNNANGGGGGIFGYGANPFNMTDVEIVGNKSEDKGAGVRIFRKNNAAANIIRCVFHRNSATTKSESKGGGIYFDGYSDDINLVLTDCLLNDNSAYRLGGAIYIHKGTLTANNCTMFNNVSYDNIGVSASENSFGGAVYINTSCTLIMNGGTVTGDSSKTNGGGIYMADGAHLQVEGNVVIHGSTVMTDDFIDVANNVYLSSSSCVIEVIGELGPDAIIGIANSNPGTYVKVANNVSYEDILEHIALDNDENGMIIDENGEVQVYEPYPWNNTTTWDGTIATITEGSYPPTTANDVTINRKIKIPSGSVAYAKNIAFGTYGSLIIEDGGQLINNNSVAVVAKKEVVAADAAAKSGWYLISSPVTSPNITGATNLITQVSDARYDLYRFNEAAELPWENYKQTSPEHSGFCVNQSTSALQNGRGYLYRNEHNHKVEISGDLDVASSVDYTLSYTAEVGGVGNIFKGFNIIGNPYSHNIAKGTGNAIPNDFLEDNYYVLNSATGAFEQATDGNIIPPLTGILVQAKNPNTTLTINKVVASGSKGVKTDNAEIQFTVSNSEFEDKVFVKFKEGRGLNKIEHLNEAVPMLYIHHNGEDFATVDLNDETKAFSLNFEAKTFGRYTLSVNPQGGYRYLHLIDRLAEKDIDLLVENEYSFIGSPADYANRFIVRLEHSDSVDDEVFAYQSENDIVVAGEGELQVFDVMGRLVMRQNVNGVQTVNGLSKGVYIMRLEGKTQKIVIR